jgi:hypothetical protein
MKPALKQLVCSKANTSKQNPAGAGASAEVIPGARILEWRSI